MADKVINALKDIGYKGPLLAKDNLQAALDDGPKSVDYTTLVNYLTKEIRVLLNLDEEVNPISEPEDSVSFIMEATSFLKELNCPYARLTKGHASERLQTASDCQLLLDYLTTELMGARILQERKPDKKIELKLHETNEAANLRLVLSTLRFPKPPPNITIPQLFQKLRPTLETTVKKAGSELVGRPAFSGTLSEPQWATLTQIQEDLHKEYTIRREMLLTRLDVTIRSFQWSDRTRGKDEDIERIYTNRRKVLRSQPDVHLSDLLAARDDIAIIEKTSSSSVRKNTRSQLNKVIIGQVPDRGGRTSEQAPPPPEMPSWQQRQPGGASGGRGGRGGNRNQGDYNKQQGRYGNNQQQGSYGNQQQQGHYSNQQQTSYGSQQQGHYGNSQQQQGSYGNQQGHYSSSQQQASYGYQQQGSYGNYGGQQNFDSAGSYGRVRSNSGGQQDNKRAKTYDSYQSERSTYADQYVQESQHNQQYHRGGGGRGGRGRSSYNRGGRSNY